MGEYATYKGSQVKIGTCEDMYYLRYDQRNLVKPERNSLNPADPDVLKVIRFRFPFPDEDGIKPGGFEQPFRHVHIPGLTPPEGLEHYSVQFTSSVGYLLSLPCPEGGGLPEGIRVAKNGWRGNVLLVQQAVRKGVLACIFQCGGCGAAWAETDPERVRTMIASLEDEEGYRYTGWTDGFRRRIVRRIREGYGEEFLSRGLPAWENPFPVEEEAG